MSTTTTENTDKTEPAEPKSPAQSLEELLADVDESTRRVVLDQVSKARDEAHGLRTRLKAAEPKLAEYDALVDAAKTDLERAQEAASTATERATKAERSALAYRVALEKGLPAELASRLQGDDEAALIADADKLRALIPEEPAAPRAPRPDPSQGSSSTPTPADPAAVFAAALQQQLGR